MPLSILGSSNLGVEVQFINVPILHKVIEENISLFQYILGPTLNSKELVNRIAFSNDSLSDILLENHVLIGIVLGFGPHNSLMGGRLDQIHFLSLSRDLAPFASKSQLLNDLKANYAFHFFNVAGGNDKLMSFRINQTLLFPMAKFLTTKEEFEAINELNESLPICLNEKPIFHFGAFKGGSPNKLFYNNLKKCQKNIRKIYGHKYFLENILTKILGKKPFISCKKPNSKYLDCSFFKGTIGVDGWQQILLQVSENFEEEGKLKFFQSFFYPPNNPVPPCSMGSTQSTLNGLKKALENLSFTNQYFKDLSLDSSLSTIVKNQLYFKILKYGHGKSLDDCDRIKIHYSITDLNDNILSANYDTWLSISQLIPGLSHGLMGMKIGEKRQIFIHSNLGYGVLTTLPPCMGLIAIVQLLDIDEKDSKRIIPLKSDDCSWIEDPSLLKEIEESIENKPIFVGCFYRRLFDKIEGDETRHMLSLLQKNLCRS